MQHLAYIYTKILFVVYLMLRFNWMSYMLSSNPNIERKKKRVYKISHCSNFIYEGSMAFFKL